MVRFQIKHAFNLKSDGNKLLFAGQYYPTDDEAKITELRAFAKDSSCVELDNAPKKLVKEEKKTVDETDDITLVKGVGKKLAEELAAKGVTTKSGLKAAVKNSEAEMKEVLGASFDKISEQLK